VIISVRTMHIFMKLLKDDQRIETCHGESSNKVNIVILLISTLYSTVAQIDLCASIIYI
jgi:hypothetical protein